MTLSVIPILFGLLLLIARFYRPWAKPPAGAIVGRVGLSLLGRLRLHYRLMAILLVLTGLGRLAGWLPPALPVFVAGAMIVLIGIPIRYTLTTDEIALGRTPARRWMEFGGVARQPGGVRLQGVAGARGMTVWLSGRPDDDDVVLLLRQLVRGSYKGRPGGLERSRPAPTPPPIGRPPEWVQVAGG